MKPFFFFGGKPCWRLGEALDAVESITTNDSGSIDIFVIPPVPSVETDEEETDNDATNIVSTNDVCGE